MQSTNGKNSKVHTSKKEYYMHALWVVLSIVSNLYLFFENYN